MSFTISDAIDQRCLRRSCTWPCEPIMRIQAKRVAAEDVGLVFRIINVSMSNSVSVYADKA